MTHLVRAVGSRPDSKSIFRQILSCCNATAFKGLVIEDNPLWTLCHLDSKIGAYALMLKVPGGTEVVMPERLEQVFYI